MLSPSDPIRREQLRFAIAGAVGLALLLLVGFWALRPMSASAVERRPSTVADSEATSEPASEIINVRAFDVALWNPKLTPADTSKEAAPPPPKPRLELVGVVCEPDGSFTAALYDPTTDEIVMGRAGQTISGHELTAVGLFGVDMRVNGREVRLDLDQQRLAAEGSGQ